MAIFNADLQPDNSTLRSDRQLTSVHHGHLPIRGYAWSCGVKKEEFWMKDPITGNWIPESQFNQIDVADLREQLLPRKNNDS
ncbi:hypothetical protein CUMW_201210 [Citrus unshiu]|uniref:Uncharacterized protein n=1 Tax=Citrus unshiu TaxID=55188 RepID=A0A2H5Q6S7_CITUN|nr:hypothetical protein CUMW_201210 [Citrus unshiu]